MSGNGLSTSPNSASPHRSTDKLFSIEMNGIHPSHNDTPPPLPPPYNLEEFTPHEEIDIGSEVLESVPGAETAIYTKICKPSIKRKLPSPPPPPHSLREPVEPVSTSISEAEPPPPHNTDISSLVLERPPHETIIYTEIDLSAKKKESAISTTIQEVDSDKVIYSDISKLSKSPSGHVVYADLNLIRAQTFGQSGDLIKKAPEKVVYADIDSVREASMKNRI